MYQVKYSIRGNRDYCSSLVHCFKGEEPSTNLILQGNCWKNGCNRMDIIEQGILKFHAQMDNKHFKMISDHWEMCTYYKATIALW